MKLSHEEQVSMWTNGLRFLISAVWGNSEFESIENHVFALRPYDYNCDDDYNTLFDRDRCNFLHKETGMMVNWYKHIGRGMELSDDRDNHFIAAVINDCLRSYIKGG